MSSSYKFSTGLKVSTDTSTPTKFVIPSGEDGSDVNLADLGGNYDLVMITCADCTAQVGYLEDDGPFDLYEQDDPSTQWSKGSLPTSGTLAFLLTHATGVRRIRLVLSNNATADVEFTITGCHRSV